jgi:hypothetical protein
MKSSLAARCALAMPCAGRYIGQDTPRHQKSGMSASAARAAGSFLPPRMVNVGPRARARETTSALRTAHFIENELGITLAPWQRTLLVGLLSAPRRPENEWPAFRLQVGRSR